MMRILMTNMAERIEVIKGPASRLYGGGAFAPHIDALYSENIHVRNPGEAVNIPGEPVSKATDGYIGNSQWSQ